MSLAVCLGAGAAAEPTPELAPSVVCDELCRKLYGSEEDKLALCREGCEDAERCITRCGERFAGDEEQNARCRYRCARTR